jgi:hypothetical protein
MEDIARLGLGLLARKATIVTHTIVLYINFARGVTIAL